MRRVFTGVFASLASAGLALTAHPEYAQAITTAYPKAAPVVAGLGVFGLLFSDPLHKTGK